MSDISETKAAHGQNLYTPATKRPTGISDDGETAPSPGLASQLGPYAAENGKPDAILIARLFAEDILFFPEEPFERRGNNLSIRPQLNIAKQEDHPFILRNCQTFFLALMDLFIRLDTSKELYIPKNNLHQKLLGPLLDDRLTGLSFLNLMAYHMVKIVEEDAKSTYSVVVDRNVIAGIPDAYHYICKFIKFAREYNEKVGTFYVHFSPAINLDGPISGKLIPVSGAADAAICGFTVQGDGTVTDGDNMIIESEHGPNVFQREAKRPVPEGTMTNAELEAKLDKDVIAGIKQYAKEALIAYKMIPIELAADSFSRLRSTNGVIARVRDMLSLGITDYCLHNTLEVSYSENTVWFEESGLRRHLTYNIRIQYEDGNIGDGFFDPNRIPNELIAVTQQLTEDEIYHTLLINAVKANDSGKTLVAPFVYDEIEVVGTQYEGRSARIEAVKVGDELYLIREPENVYDKNAIDVQNAAGSLGHLPSHIAERLSHVIDMGLITCTAIVSEVLPLSKRGARAKKAILKVRLNYRLVECAKEG